MKRVLLLTVMAAVATSPAAAARPTLKRFASCDRLIAYGTKHRPQYRPGGPPPQFEPTVSRRPTTDVSGPVPAAAPEAAGDSSGDFSLTNNQEAGVFEPDTVKTDGKTVYAVTPAGVLEVVDVRSAPKVIGELTLPQGYDHQLLLYQGRILAASTAYDGKTTLTLVDVKDGTKPAVEQTMAVNGTLLAQRRTKGTVRVVVSVTPQAIAVDNAPVSARAWVPRATIAGKRRTLVGCKQIRRPRAFTGLEELTVLTIDLDAGLAPVDADAVMTGGGTVYASAENLYVATHRYSPRLEGRRDGAVPDDQTTQIHRFSLDDARNTTYRGSGSVPGFILNQFSLSEDKGVLRVASTEEPPWFERSVPDSQSLVTTLGQTDTGMAKLGQVAGLGKGERIYAVRFFGDQGYVVTYRQMDPLFTLDLADPARPTLEGELELPGFSSYLHPISGDRLIGVGTSAQGGTQLSEFDVSDLAKPKLQQQTEVEGGSTEVSYDHHAFLWWEPRSLAVLPITTFTGGPTPSCPPDQPCPSFAPSRASASAFAFTVTPSAITEAGRVTHPDQAVVHRSIVLGDRLLTVSDAGLQASALDGYGDAGFAPFTASSGTATPPSP